MGLERECRIYGRKEGVQEENFSVLELEVSVHLPFFT